MAPKRTISIGPLLGAGALVLLLIAWAVIGFSGSDSGGNGSSSSDTTTHKDPEAGFALTVPNDWTEMDMDSGVMQSFAPTSPGIAYDPRWGSTAPDGQAVVVVLYTSPSYRPEDADSMFDRQEKQFRARDPNATIERHQIDGHPAMNVSLTLPSGVGLDQEVILRPGELLTVAGLAPAGADLQPATKAVDTLKLF